MRLLPVSLVLLLGLTPAIADTMTTLLAQARSAQSQGKTALAERLAQSAIVADPANPDAYVGLGDIYARQGQSDFARSYYDKALDIDPQQAAALKAIAALDKESKPDTASAAR
jgi:Flp pilus assembly protein TadD